MMCPVVNIEHILFEHPASARLVAVRGRHSRTVMGLLPAALRGHAGYVEQRNRPFFCSAILEF